jgi:anti-anti-sigma factor
MTPEEGRPDVAEARTDGRHPGDSGDPGAIVDSFEALSVGVLATEGPEHVCTAINRTARALLGDQVRLGESGRSTARDDRLVWLLDQAYRSGAAVSSGEIEVSEHRLIVTATPLLTAGVVRGVTAQLLDVTAEVGTREAAAVWADEIGQRRLATRSFALAVQHALLPEFLPVLPGVRLAAHYRVAASERGAGGDWFDAVPLPGGRLALAAGDVAGHGAKASATMSQLRAALTTSLLDGYDVAEVSVRLDRFVARMPGAGGTTLGLAILDPATGELSYACSGHPPPLVVTADGVAGYLPADPGVPLGTLSATPGIGRTRLEPGDLLLLFTDGLVERSGRTLVEGLAELRGYLEEAAARAADPGGLDELCRDCVEEMTEDEPDDDVSLIAVLRTDGAAAQFRRELTATVGALPALRTELTEWLGPIGASELDLQDIQIAVGEAVANVIEHAYVDADGAEGPVTVEMYHDPDGRVCITVADAGTWRAPPVEPAERGRGLIMIRSCMDTVEIDSSEEGTALQMDRRLRHPPALGPGGAGPGSGGPGHGGPGHGGPRHRAVRARVAETAFGAVVRRSPRPELVVRGPVDTSTAASFREHLSDASRGGTLPLHIDLTEVTHLASAGIQALFEFVEQMASDGRSLLLTAPPSSPARYVLELTGLDHLVTPSP